MVSHNISFFQFSKQRFAEFQHITSNLKKSTFIFSTFSNEYLCTQGSKSNLTFPYIIGVSVTEAGTFYSFAHFLQGL